MPAEVANPVMPEELENPIEPDWSLKCPKYGGDAARQAEWTQAQKAKWMEATHVAKLKWQQSTLDNRARFVESAALRAESAHVKMIGLIVKGERQIYAWEPDKGIAQILEKEAQAQKVALFSAFMLEHQMFQRFFKDLVALMESGLNRVSKTLVATPRLITYYGNTFDLAFMARRAAIVGEPGLMRFLRLYRRGRYLDGQRFVDLHEDWVAGDRETKTGGLEGLAKMLGIEDVKKGQGASFYHYYQQDPSEGLAYLLRDLHLTEQCAMRMGF